jgi:hypothetical protein
MGRKKLNIEKMSRMITRNTPDQIWRTFTYTRERDYVEGYDEWCDRFVRNMKLKHGKKLKGITVFQSVMDEPMGSVRVQLVAELYD